VARDAGAAAALGVSSLRTWLKLPATASFEKVAAATTLPILLLGGPAHEDMAGMLSGFSSAMSAGVNVRGLMIGRNITFARTADPRAAAAAAAAVVRTGAKAGDAAALLEDEAGRDLDELIR
jgi:DhnA family fructose-bisphosphate aldolase class Ia